MPSVVASLLRPVVGLSTRGLGPGRPVAAQRANAERVAGLVPKPSGVAYAERELGGVRAHKVTPPDDREGRALLYLHGGAHVVGSASTDAAEAGRIAKAARATTWVLDHRRAPEHPYPAAVEDTVAAYDALAATIDPAGIVLVGKASGGGVALAALHALRDRGSRLPAGAVLVSPWLDLTLSGESVTSKAHVDKVLDAAWLDEMATLYAGDADRRDVSPLFADHAGLPPLVVFAGTDELLLTDSVRLAEHAQAAGVEVQLVVESGMWHGYPAAAPLVPEAVSALYEIGRFVDVRTSSR